MRRREKDMRRRWLTWIRGKRQGDTFSVVVVFFVVYEIRSRETGRGVRPKEEGVAERLRLNYFTCRRILSFFPSTLYCYSPQPLCLISSSHLPSCDLLLFTSPTASLASHLQAFISLVHVLAHALALVCVGKRETKGHGGLADRKVDSC